MVAETLEILHAVTDFTDFVESAACLQALQPIAWYEGRCPQSGQLQRLPRTAFAEALGRGLMQQLAALEQAPREGKMYGVLLVSTPAGGYGVLKAFSGWLQGRAEVAGWVPPIAGRDRLRLEERQTLAQLEALKQELIELQTHPIRQKYAEQVAAFEREWQALTQVQKQHKQARQLQREQSLATLSGRALTAALAQLEDQSCQASGERRRWKQHRATVLAPLQTQIATADAQIQRIKRQRKALSQSLQVKMEAAYHLTNFAGESRSLEALRQRGALPTGAGDCCAPKLLHAAAVHGLQPLALAEFWWGGDDRQTGRIAGKFYGACRERCQPLLGFLLSGLPEPNPPLEPLVPEIIYQDDWVIAVNKPAGLLTVPGRSSDRQASVLSYLQSIDLTVRPIHRLDQATSGILLLARDRLSQQRLQAQFQQRKVHKRYEAVMAGVVLPEAGTITLPLRPDLQDRPRQLVDWQVGKVSQTQFRVLERGRRSRLELLPLTGRTHQLRVHTANLQGLNCPIWGDRLYGINRDPTDAPQRLYLHAQELRFQHPQTAQIITLRVPPSF